MIISTIEAQIPEAQEVSVTGDTLKAELADGRAISVPLAWYPRLVHAAPGGKTEAFARKLAGTGKPLLTLDSPANANLMQMGARALSLHFSPRGEAKCVRGPSGLGASRAEEKGARRGCFTVHRPSDISSGANQALCLRFSRNTAFFSCASTVGW